MTREKGTEGIMSLCIDDLIPSVPFFLPDRDRLAALDAFHCTLEGQRRALRAHRFKPGK